MRIAGSSPAARLALAQEMPSRSVDLAVLVLLAGTLLLSIALGGIAIALLRPRVPTPVGVVSYQIGERAFAVPRAWLRPAMPLKGGRVDRIDLVIPWPGATAAEAAGAQGAAGGMGAVVLLNVAASDDAPDPAERVERIYSRFLTDGIAPAAEGLVARQFRPGSPYEHERLFLSAPDGRAFAARCAAPQQGARQAGSCLADMRLDGLDVQVIFAPERLADWQRLAGGVRKAIAAIRR